MNQPTSPTHASDRAAGRPQADISADAATTPSTLEEHLAVHHRLGEEATLRRLVRALERSHLGIGPGDFRRLTWEDKIAFLAKASRLLDKPLRPEPRVEPQPRAERRPAAKKPRRRRRPETLWLDLDERRAIVEFGAPEEPEVPTLREHLAGRGGLGRRATLDAILEALQKSAVSLSFDYTPGDSLPWIEVLHDFARSQAQLGKRMNLDLFCDLYPEQASAQGSALSILWKVFDQAGDLFEEESSFCSSYSELRLKGRRRELRAFLAEVGLHPRVQVVEGSEEELEDEQDALDAELRAEMEKEDEETS